MDENHEILPSPQTKSPEATNQQQELAPRGLHSSAVESERIAGKAMETPAHAPPASQQGAHMATGQSQSVSTGAMSPVQPQQHATQVAVDDFMTGLPQIADDIDLIEKEWVNKTKDIVQQTKDDPYNQNRQIVRLRADYMKKRYNKDIKLAK